MPARLAMRVGARERLRRLAVVFAVELRLKIVAELYLREMSSAQFYAEFGGGSPTRVHKNFRTLTEEGWLRLVRVEGPGGDRRGGREHFYRATEPPFFDAECWALLPYSVRVTSSLNLFRQIAPRLRRDLEGASEATGCRRDLSCTPFVLDEEGWKRAIEAIGNLFARMFEEQEDARRRALHSGEELTRANVLITAFQSAGNLGPAVGDLLQERRRDPLIPFAERLAPILKDDVCLEIVSELNRRELSVTQFHRELGGASKPSISRKFKGLEAGGWATRGKRVTGGTRRGASEQFYIATKPSIDNYDPCDDAPSALRETQGWQAFEHLCEKVKEAMMSGGFDARTDRCLSWSMLSLDRQGRENVNEGIDSLLELISQEQRLALGRIAKSGEKPVTMTVGLAAFEAAADTTKAP